MPGRLKDERADPNKLLHAKADTAPSSNDMREKTHRWADINRHAMYHRGKTRVKPTCKGKAPVPGNEKETSTRRIDFIVTSKVPATVLTGFMFLWLLFTIAQLPPQDLIPSPSPSPCVGHQ
ncbi:hypothetical protein N7528_010220 [Penicillium herquei]|nr:hypothetical protein N7528_010220 [Penicillium herquei]